MLVENMQGQCWHCGQQLVGADYHRESVCPSCSKASHVCKNCTFYQPGIANNCRETIAEPVTDKQRANFCDYFEPGKQTHSTTATNAENLTKAADDLFN